MWYKQTQRNQEEGKMEKQRMTTYWRDSQIAADNTIAKFVPLLARQVESHTRLFEIVSSLRNPANDTQAKARLFEELKVAGTYRLESTRRDNSAIHSFWLFCLSFKSIQCS